MHEAGAIPIGQRHEARRRATEDGCREGSSRTVGSFAKRISSTT